MPPSVFCVQHTHPVTRVVVLPRRVALPALPLDDVVVKKNFRLTENRAGEGIEESKEAGTTPLVRSTVLCTPAMRRRKASLAIAALEKAPLHRSLRPFLRSFDPATASSHS